MRSLLLVLSLASSALAIRHLTCHFTMRDFFGNYVDVMRKCPQGTSYCATRVVNSTGWNSLVIDYFDWYCENEKNVSRHLRTTKPPTEGCYTYGPNRDEHVCFCDKDFCNEKSLMEGIFLRHAEREEKFLAQRTREMAIQEQLLRQQKIVQHQHRRPLHQIQVPPPPTNFGQPPPPPSVLPPPPPPVNVPPPPPPNPVAKRIPSAHRPPLKAPVSSESQLPPQPADVHRITVTKIAEAEPADNDETVLNTEMYTDDLAPTLAPLEPEVRELSSAEMAAKNIAPKQTKSRSWRIQ